MKLTRKFYNYFKNIICLAPIFYMLLCILIACFSYDLTSTTSIIAILQESMNLVFEGPTIFYDIWTSGNNFVFMALMRVIDILFGYDITIGSGFDLYLIVSLSYYICMRLFFVIVDALMYFITFADYMINEFISSKRG